jgi:hypothetical protein
MSETLWEVRSIFMCAITNSLELNANGEDVDDEMDLRRELSDAEMNTNLHTEKVIRKKGRKWSNISVKKYHHKPAFGVKSGRDNLVGRTQKRCVK